LKKLSSFVWTDKWLVCLPKCMYPAVNGIFHISIRINCNRISEDLLCTEL
jgi:hypothetical protein